MSIAEIVVLSLLAHITFSDAGGDGDAADVHPGFPSKIRAGVSLSGALYYPLPQNVSVNITSDTPGR